MGISSLVRPLRFALRALALTNRYYDVDGVYNHLVRFVTTEVATFETPYVDADTTRKLVGNIVDQLSQISNKYPDLYAFELKAAEKWLGRQGGISPWSDQRPSVLEYVAQPDPFNLESVIEPGLRQQVIEDIGLSISSWRTLAPYAGSTLYDTYRGMKKSNSGIFYWKDRRDPRVRLHSFSESLRTPYVMDPVVLGQRKQRNKVRDIFMDSMPNLFRFNRVLRPLHDFVANNSPHIAWRGDHFDEKHIYQWVGHRKLWYSLESDVESMDKRMTLEVTEAIMAEFLRLPFVSPALREEYLKYVSLTFNIDILTPEGLLKGQKKLLSGLPPTNDYESFVNWYVLTSFLYHHRRAVDGASLNTIDHFIIVKGDDSSILFSEDVLNVTDLSGTQMTITAAVAAWYNKFRLTARVDKQAYRTGTTMFCKRFYYPTLSQYTDIAGSTHSGSAYSLVLAINSIVHPEVLNSPKDVKYQFVRILQILDNCAFHPLWRALVNRLVELGILPLVRVTDDDVNRFNAIERDWRWYLYGEKFSLDNSPTYRYVASRIGVVEAV